MQGISSKVPTEKGEDLRSLMMEMRMWGEMAGASGRGAGGSGNGSDIGNLVL